ncbi:hypothetical protein CAL26_06810 [Bordetella genomosp. 9]|uniref:Uncharacterized protein n=2 Tax=Bordetella genomosp. 9 TaxID=1416803 RepID=A0A261RE20_9BORD|nr:hypothetical protein CAL26_06810 [Bordetella genomosp. 9]
MFPTAREHRPRIVDTLRVIHATQTGRELLHDFRTLGERGKHPTIALADGGDIPRKEAEKPHCLYLAADSLTAGASRIGVPPEVEQAPSMLLRLTQVRNALAGRSPESRFTKSPTDVLDVWLDPVSTVVKFRKELEVHERTPSASLAAENGRHSLSTPLMPDQGPADGDPPLPPGRARAFLCIPLRKDSRPAYMPVVAVDAADATEVSRPGKARMAFRWAAQQVQKFAGFMGRQDAADDCRPRGEPAALKEARLGHRRTSSTNEVPPAPTRDGGTGNSANGTAHNGE